jgi:hypothetical protein
MEPWMDLFGSTCTAISFLTINEELCSPTPPSLASWCLTLLLMIWLGLTDGCLL